MGRCSRGLSVGRRLQRIDTVNLAWKFYLLIEFDVEKIKQQYETVTPILVVNPDAFSEITPIHAAGAVKVGEPLYKAVVK